MRRNENNACQEYQNLSRRQFLTGASTLAAGLVLPTWVPSVAFASSGSIRDALIVIYLRGGADGLTFCVPHGDANYYSLRPTISVPQPGSGLPSAAIDLNGFYGLPPAFQALKEVYDNGHFGLIQAVGRPNWTRSHFEAQKIMDVETDEVSQGGWLARHLATTQPLNAEGSIRAIAYADAVPRALSRAQQIVVTRNPEDYRFNNIFSNQEELNQAVGRMYALVADDTRPYVRDAQRAAIAFANINFGGYIPSGGAFYGESQIGNSLKYSAALLKSSVGVELIHMDAYGWDTHVEQGSTDGELHQNMLDLGSNLAAFYKDMAGSNVNYTVIVMSEFGRQVKENGGKGTDHGTAGCMLMMGPGVNGGQIHGTWPGLQQANLFEGVDLKPTTDYRLVLRELLTKRLQNPNVQAVIPNAPTGNTNFFKAA
ncbi:MAG: DUF1501 domain-containing protein [Fimbriimonadaceae bacterium]|nr:DUF1501 domain-containing protein [Fimbriimonadaceae bacterium]